MTERIRPMPYRAQMPEKSWVKGRIKDNLMNNGRVLTDCLVFLHENGNKNNNGDETSRLTETLDRFELGCNIFYEKDNTFAKAAEDLNDLRVHFPNFRWRKLSKPFSRCERKIGKEVARKLYEDLLNEDGSIPVSIKSYVTARIKYLKEKIELSEENI